MSKVSRQFLIYTFMIMTICWGTCMICSFNNLSLEKDYFLYVPYLLGGWSPTIASFIVLLPFRNCVPVENEPISIIASRRQIFCNQVYKLIFYLSNLVNREIKQYK